MGASGDVDYSRFVRDLSDENRFWLPCAAEKLNISPNIKDYVIVPTIIMPSDLPNRNAVAFGLDQLTGWAVDAGMPAYKTWTGKPTFVEHKNDDPSQAKGIIFDSTMSPIPNTDGGLWKVMCLLGFDRTRDPALANDIMTGRKRCYSMGANAKDFACSICGALASQNGCEHVSPPGSAPKLKTDHNGYLAFSYVIDPCGFETSSVSTPAYLSASDCSVLNW